MARQKKDDTGELLVSIEQFTRTRDSVRNSSYAFVCSCIATRPSSSAR
jgi:hypothetical protein